jgi:hypothetical protein
MTSYTVFGDPAGFPATNFNELPPAFQTAMSNSQKGRSTLTDDNNMGSALTGYGYCADPTYRQQIYCACVNAPIAFPECVFLPCANSDGLMGSYKTSNMQKALEDASKNCPQTVNCTQVFQMGGSGNIAPGVSQSMNCGGVVNNMITNIQAHPFLTIVVLVLILSVVMLVSGSGKSSSKGPSKTLPPPQLVMPSTL